MHWMKRTKINLHTVCSRWKPYQVDGHISIFKFRVNFEYLKKRKEKKKLVSTCDKNGVVVNNKESVVWLGKTELKTQNTSPVLGKV
jgi:hypothetical protein